MGNSVPASVLDAPQACGNKPKNESKHINSFFSRVLQWDMMIDFMQVTDGPLLFLGNRIWGGQFSPSGIEPFVCQKPG